MHCLMLVLCFAAVLCCAVSHGDRSMVDELTIVDPSILVTSSRIVGGSPATISQYPYAVQLARNGGHVCGGSLLTRRHVLTAAHCLIDWSTLRPFSPTTLSIRAGTTDRNTGGQTARLNMFVIHERYNMFTQDADVAVLVLNSQVTLGTNVATAAVPRQGSALPYNTTLVTVGWGTTSPGGLPSSVLLQVQVDKVNWTVCESRYRQLANATGRTYVVTSSMICAGRLDIGGADACQGDSGGPLIAFLNNRDVVVGVTSWGEGCGDPVYPGVSARVANFTNWITDVVARYNSAPTLNLADSVMLLASLMVSVAVKGV